MNHCRNDTRYVTLTFSLSRKEFGALALGVWDDVAIGIFFFSRVCVPGFSLDRQETLITIKRKLQRTN